MEPGRADANPWDGLGTVFGGHEDDDAIPVAAADNELIAWPSVIECLQAATEPGARVLDFGCGGGRFAASLQRDGYDVVGLDASSKMIDSAEAAHPDTTFVCGDTAALARLGTFDAVTSIMVLQFIEEIDSALARLANAIQVNGILVFAVHNPAYVMAHPADTSRFALHGANTWGPYGTFRLADAEIPIFLRDQAAYDAIAAAAGLTRVFSATPPFTDAFVERFAWNGPTGVPAYLILGYRRHPTASLTA